MNLREGNIIVCDCGAELNPEIITAQDYIKYVNETATCSKCGGSGVISFPLPQVVEMGLSGNGVMCNDLAFSALIANISTHSNLALEPGGIYVVTKPIILTKPITIDLMGSTIVCKNSVSVFDIQSDNVRIMNGELDLNFTTRNGIKALGASAAYAGVTGSIEEGSLTLTLTSIPEGLAAAKYITIAGIDGYKRILVINGNEITLDNSANTTVTNAEISYFNPYSNLFFENLFIRDQLPSALNLEGGIYLSNVENARVDKCRFNNIYNPDDPGIVDRAPAIKFSVAYNVYANDNIIENGGVGINVFSVRNAYFNNTVEKNMHDNGFYLQGDSFNVNINGFMLDQVEEGIVFKTYSKRDENNKVSSVKISNGEIRRAKTHGLSLRQGSGLDVSQVSFVECKNNIGQSGNTDYWGVSDVKFSDISCFKNKGAVPIQIGNDIAGDGLHGTAKHISFDGLTMQGFETLGVDGLNLGKGCSDFRATRLKLIGDGINLKNGVQISGNADDIVVEGDMSGYTGQQIRNDSTGVNVTSKVNGIPKVNNLEYQRILPDGTMTMKLPTTTTDLSDGEVYLQSDALGGKVLRIRNQDNIRFSTDLGLVIKLINKTGAVTIKGTVVGADSSLSDAFTLPVNEYSTIGIVFEGSIADGLGCLVAVAGKARVLLKDGTSATRGHIVYASDIPGRVITAAPSIPTDFTYLKRIGMCTESRSSGTNVLTTVILD